VNVPRIVVFLNKCDMVDDSEPRSRRARGPRAVWPYGFPGDETPVIRGSATGAIPGRPAGSEYRGAVARRSTRTSRTGS
jgi:elongation factor Tu